MWDKIKTWWTNLPMWAKILVGAGPFLLFGLIYFGMQMAKKARNRKRTARARSAKKRKGVRRRR